MLEQVKHAGKATKKPDSNSKLHGKVSGKRRLLRVLKPHMDDILNPLCQISLRVDMRVIPLSIPQKTEADRGKGIDRSTRSIAKHCEALRSIARLWGFVAK